MSSSKPSHAASVRSGLERDLVGELDPLEHGRHLVLAVPAAGPDDEREVDLRVRLHGEQPLELDELVRRERLGAYVRGRRPDSVSASAALSRDGDACERERVRQRLAAVGERGLDDSLDLRKRSGSGRRRKATSAESTFGGGRKTVRETGWKPVRSAASWTSTETAPYAFVPGAAKKRSATSRWTMTHQRSIAGRPSRLSTTIGVATLYGRFATSLRGGGSRSREVELQRVAELEPEVRYLGQVGYERAVDLDGVDERDASRRGSG